MIKKCFSQSLNNDGRVAFNEKQCLTPKQKEQARKNIGLDNFPTQDDIREIKNRLDNDETMIDDISNELEVVSEQVETNIDNILLLQENVLKAKTTVSAGKNIEVEEEVMDDGHTKYTINNTYEDGVEEAPSDGVEYARKNKSWVPVSGGGGSQPVIDGKVATGYNVVINGNKYPAVRVYANGVYRLWMAKNLDEPIGTIGTDEFYYNDDEVYAKRRNLGRLYTWQNLDSNLSSKLVEWGIAGAVGAGTSTGGWWLPRTNEWSHLKAVDPSAKGLFALNDEQSATNKFGTSLIRGGRKYNGSYGIIDTFGYFPCSNYTNKTTGCYFYYATPYNSSENFTFIQFPNTTAGSVRLVLDLNNDGSIPEEFKDYVVLDANPLASVEFGKNKFHLRDAMGEVSFSTLIQPSLDLLRPEDFGAAGDGITDDTDAFRRAFEYNLGVVGTPGKRYYVKNLSLGVGTRKVLVMNCNFVTPRTDKSEDCLLLQGYAEVNGCTITGFKNAITATPSARAIIKARIINNRINECLNGVNLYTPPTATPTSSVSCFDLFIEGNYIHDIGNQLGASSMPPDNGTGRCIKVHGHMDGVRIQNNVLEYAWCGVEIGNDATYFWAPGWSITDNFFEGHSLAPIYISNFSFKEGTGEMLNRRCQLSVHGNYFSDHDGGSKNHVYGSYDFWITDWVSSIYPCYGNQKDIIGLLKSGSVVMNNGAKRLTNGLYMCGNGLSSADGTQMKSTDITMIPGFKKYSSEEYDEQIKITYYANITNGDISVTNGGYSVGLVKNGYGELVGSFKSRHFIFSRLLTGNEYIYIKKIEVM